MIHRQPDSVGRVASDLFPFVIGIKKNRSLKQSLSKAKFVRHLALGLSQ